MIVDISLDYLNDGGNPVDKAILIGNIIEHCHYIKPRAGIVDAIWGIVEQHGTPHIKEIFQSYSEYLSLPEDMERHLTTIVLADFPLWQQRIILFKPSELLLENGPYEWNIYKNLIRAYTNHRKFGNVFRYLQHKVEDCLLVPENGGGFGAFKAVAEMKNKGEYYSKYRKKVCMVFDRDTRDATYFDDKKKHLFEYLVNKDYLHLGEDDINTFNYNGYVWHMLWKNAIENYFPPEKYEAKGVDMTEARASADYDYYKFKDDEHGYKKTMMESISDGKCQRDRSVASAYQTALKKKDDIAIALALSPFARKTAELVKSGAYEAAAGSCYVIFRCLAKTSVSPLKAGMLAGFLQEKIGKGDVVGCVKIDGGDW